MIRSVTSRRLIIVGVLLLAGIGGIAHLLITGQRAATMAETERATTTLARVLAEQTSNSMQAVDLTLREIIARLTSAGAGDPDSVAASGGTRAMFNLLVERLKALPQTDALVVVGADGRMMANSRGFPTTTLDLSDRDYFQYFTTRDEHAAFISTPVHSYMTGLWSVYMSRRINGARGEFAGVVAAVVTLSQMEDFYRAVTPPGGSVTVLRRDGTILLRYPHNERDIGRKLPSEAPWYRFLGENGGSYWSPGYVNKIPSLISVRPLRDFPLVIDTGTTEASALAIWRQHTLWILAGAAMAATCVVFLLWVFGAQYDRLARQNAQLESGRVKFDAVLENISQGLTFFDSNQKLMISNRRYAEIYRLSAEQTSVGTLLSDILDHRMARGSFPRMSRADYLARRQRLARAGKPFDVTDELRDGRVVSMHYQPLPENGWVSTHEDITERRNAEANLAYMARHDALTNLANRTLFRERLEQATAISRRGTECALLCLDLDRFKVINDTLGHPVGDGLLRAVATRLLAAVRQVDTVARLGGDEFAIIQVGLALPDHAAFLANRILKVIHQPYDIDGHKISVGVSIGIAMASGDEASLDILQKNADIALYLAKSEGRGIYRFFEPEMDARFQERNALELDLRNALLGNEFELRYQPFLDLDSGKITGFETLIRWNHPARGLVMPADFIPIAEETGLIIAIGEWVLRTACQEAASWPRDIDIAVNLSPSQFKAAHFIDMVQQVLATSGLPPNRLELEITESVLLQNTDDKLLLLHQLHALGIRIALDDFGTGYSSLSYLRSFPFDKIKIDQSFIRDLNTNKDSTFIVGTIIDLARGLGMTVTAEGVETAEQLATLRSQGCSKVQGYLFSRPRLASEVPLLTRTLNALEQRLLQSKDCAGAPQAAATAEVTVFAGPRHS